MLRGGKSVGKGKKIQKKRGGVYRPSRAGERKKTQDPVERKRKMAKGFKEESNSKEKSGENSKGNNKKK